MAGLVVMAMIAFVFLGNPGMMGSRNASGGREEPIVKTTKFGNLGAWQLQTLRFNRMVLVEFFERLKFKLTANKQQPYALTKAARAIGPANNESVIDKWLFAREAEAMGITVDEKTVNSFLDVLHNQSLSRQDILAILKEIRAGNSQGVSEADFLLNLREELLALRYRQLFHQIDDDFWVGGSATPDERWASFKRLNEQATIEVALVSPQDFIKQVPAPSGDALRQFFEAHKQSYALPYSPQPGFHVPRKVNIEYLEADEEKCRSVVTEAEITQRYEKNPQSYARAKENFAKEEKDERAERARDAAAKEAEKKNAEVKTEKKPETGKQPDASKKPDAEKKPEAEKKPDAAKAAPAETKPKADAKPAVETKPAPEAKPGPETKPAVDSKPTPGPKNPEPAKAASPTKSSTTTQRSPFRLVAFADDKPSQKSEATKDDKKQAATPATTPPAAKPADEKKPTDEKKPADVQKPVEAKKPADEKKPDAGKKTVEDKKPEAKATVPDSTKKDKEAKSEARAAKENVATKENESKEAPLPPIKTAEQRLREQIRDEIAQEKLQDTLTKIQSLLASYRQEWVQYDTAKDKSTAQKPTPPDFGALATEHKMSAGRTGLVSQLDLMETDVGKSVNRQQRMSVAQLMFGATTLYKPDVSDDMKGFPSRARVYFVFWKTDDQPDHVPAWDEPGIQAEVLRLWKFDKARELAIKRADELKAEAVAKSGKPLKELTSGKKKDFMILSPPPFSYLTQNLYGELQCGEVLGLEKIAFRQESPFLQKVFGMAPNQVDVATNLPKTEVYVVRAVEFTPFKELWSNFIDDKDQWSLYTTLFTPNGLSERTAGLIQVMREDQGSVQQAWLERVKADAGFEMKKSAEQQRSAPGQQSPGPSPLDEE